MSSNAAESVVLCKSLFSFPRQSNFEVLISWLVFFFFYFRPNFFNMSRKCNVTLIMNILSVGCTHRVCDDKRFII